jgi:hypothetical protein
MVPGDRPVIEQEKGVVDPAWTVLVERSVERFVSDVLQTQPLVVTADPPSEVITPPEVAVV